MSARIEIVPAEAIKPHEIADPARERRIERRLREDGVLRDPLLVGEVQGIDGYVLLDGTNRRLALASLGLRWSMVQIVDYANPNAVELKTWAHSSPMLLDVIVDWARHEESLDVVPVPALEAADMLAAHGTLAVALDGEESYGLVLRPAHVGSRAELLRELVDLYEESLTRVDCEPDDVEERARLLRAAPGGPQTLVAFPRFTPGQVRTMAARELLIPAGITRHVILSGRALRVNLPLGILHEDKGLNDARQALRVHLAGLQPRTYRETTILYDS